MFGNNGEEEKCVESSLMWDNRASVLILSWIHRVNNSWSLAGYTV